ncbi:RDD family protein [Flavobacterium suzhouense]|uniref:RDD family protein n=1 Tax=Flavobacterium suzhouense TaxID=1529638 RepID=A0ABW5NUB7_9FLAO
MRKPFEITYGMLATGNKRFQNFIIDSIVTTLLQIGFAKGGDMLYGIYGIKGFQVGPPVLGNIKYTILALGISIVYYGLFETVNMRTLGKYITNTMVVNADGTRPDSMRIFLRTLCRLIPLEFITFFGRRPVGLHDGLSKTLVVDIAAFREAQIKQANKENNEQNSNDEQG